MPPCPMRSIVRHVASRVPHAPCTYKPHAHAWHVPCSCMPSCLPLACSYTKLAHIHTPSGPHRHSALIHTRTHAECSSLGLVPVPATRTRSAWSPTASSSQWVATTARARWAMHGRWTQARSLTSGGKSPTRERCHRPGAAGCGRGCARKGCHSTWTRSHNRGQNIFGLYGMYARHFSHLLMPTVAAPPCPAPHHHHHERCLRAALSSRGTGLRLYGWQ